MGIQATVRWSGLTVSTSRSSTCSTRALPNTTRGRSNRTRSRTVIRSRATAPTCCRSTTHRRVLRRRSSTIPYSRSREALEQLNRNSAPHPCHGIKMRFVNPAIRRLHHAHDRGVHAVPAGGLQWRAVSADRRDDLRRGRRSGAHAHWRHDLRLASARYLRRRRRGRLSRTRRRRMPCCSASRIALRSRRSGLWREQVPMK